MWAHRLSFHTCLGRVPLFRWLVRVDSVGAFLESPKDSETNGQDPGTKSMWSGHHHPLCARGWVGWPYASSGMDLGWQIQGSFTPTPGAKYKAISFYGIKIWVLSRVGWTRPGQRRGKQEEGAAARGEAQRVRWPFCGRGSLAHLAAFLGEGHSPRVPHGGARIPWQPWTEAGHSTIYLLASAVSARATL